MSDTDDQRPKTTRRLLREAQEAYLTLLLEVRALHLPLRDLKVARKVVIVGCKLRRLTAGWTKDPIYQQKLKEIESLAEEIQRATEHLRARTKALGEARDALKVAGTTHYETLMARRHPSLAPLFAAREEARKTAADLETTHLAARRVYFAARDTAADAAKLLREANNTYLKAMKQTVSEHATEVRVAKARAEIAARKAAKKEAATPGSGT